MHRSVLIIGVAVTAAFYAGICADSFAQEQKFSFEGSDRPLTVEEVRRLYSSIVCKDACLITPERNTLKEQQHRLKEVAVELGERVVPALIVMLQSAKDFEPDSTPPVDSDFGPALNLARLLECDISPLLPIIRELAQSDNKLVRAVAAYSVAQMTSDFHYVLKNLEDEDLSVRKWSVELLKSVVDPQIADRMEGILTKRKNQMTPEQMKRDTSIAALEKATAQIRKRESEKQESAKPAEPPQVVPEPPSQLVTPPDTIWRNLCLIVAGFVLAGLVLFLLMRWKKKAA